MTQIRRLFHDKGMPPLDEPLAGAAITKRLREDREQRGEKPTAANTRLRCSDAHACSRRIAFGMLKIPRDIPLSDDSLMAFKAGDFYHQIAQEALTLALGARCEVPIDWSPQISLSGHCDAVYDGGDAPVAVEIKSMGGYGFEYAVGNRKSQSGPGPKPEHLVQAGLYALAPQIRAAEVHIVYLSKDRGTCAEWLIGVDQPLTHLADSPTVESLVAAEIERLQGLLKRVDGGQLPKRFIPGFGVVDDPPESGSRAQPWNCRFCAWQPTCAGLPTEPVAIELLNTNPAAA